MSSNNATAVPTSAAPSGNPSSPAASASPAPSSSAPPASSAAPASSNPPAASSSRVAATSAAAPATSNNPSPTLIVTASSAPPQTIILTIVSTPSATAPNETPSVVIITSVRTQDPSRSTVTVGNSANPTSTDATQLQNAQKANSSGLSTGGKTAIAVVVPVVVVALLVLAGILLWRRRKQRKNNEDERRKEVEEYGFNPNHDPTLPAVGMGSEMTEDQSGYRGWGNTATSSNRKASTTLTSGMTYSDSNSNPGGYQIPGSPTHDGQSVDPLMNRRETMDSDGIGALGAVGDAAPNSTNNQVGVHRGPSNASSSYSAAGRSDTSGDYPGMAMGNPQEYYEQSYYQNGPYNNEPYGTAGGQQQQPIIRDVSARRNTRIENPSVFPQQGNSGIAQNF